ncbi:ADP-ribosylglycohydrolase family protein [Anaerocolumna jejuensis]|uniref:ADP-ribosylglycohydrolase family protein n=1 Tax=Anaerocolumna jejuensis TaxID=259063 RepID=UPI003F7C3250
MKSDNYKDTVLKAVNLGGDTDTIAAIAGGLAGIYYGFDGIPDKWVQSIVRKEELYDIFTKFSSLLEQ